MIQEGPGLLYTIAVFLPVLTVLVFVHELGHYLVARWCKVKVEVFSIGFGKELFGWNDKHGTRWKFSAIPLGGYVKFFGDSTGASNPDDDVLESMTTEEREVSFHFKPLWQRAAVVFAGPLVNIVFAIFLFAGLFYINGQRVLTSEVGILAPNITDSVEVGDIVLSIDGTDVDRFSDIAEIVQLLPGQTIDLVVSRGGHEITTQNTIGTRLMKDRFGNEYAIGTLNFGPKFLPWVEDVDKNSPAFDAGLQANDLIIEIDGIEVDEFQAVYNAISTRANETVSLKVLRDGVPVALIITIGERPSLREGQEDLKIGFIGIRGADAGEYFTYNIFGALSEGTRKSITTLRMITTTLGQLVMGMRSVTEMGGPVRMAAIVGEVAQRGIEDLIILMAMISINLGFVNLLPIPMLDGGHLLFYGLEAAKGSPLPKRAQEWAFMLGFVFVIGLMLFLTLNDLQSIAL